MVDFLQPARLGSMLQDFAAQQNTNVQIRNLLINTPPVVANMPTDALLSGTIIASNKDSNITTIKTSAGNVLVQTPIPLVEQDTVMFKVIDNGANLKLQLISINNGELPILANKDNVMFRMQVHTQPSSEQPSQLEVSDEVTITGDVKSGEIIGKQAYAILLSQGDTKAAGLPTKWRVANGSGFEVKLLGLASSASQEIDSANMTLKMTVIGQEASGETIAKTPLGILRFSEDLNLPKQTIVQLQILAIQEAMTAANNVVQNRHEVVSGLINRWHSLVRLIEALQASQPDEALKVVKHVLPQADHALAAKLSAFISAVRGGDIEKWLGSSVVAKLMQNKDEAVLDNLRSDFLVLKELLAAEKPQHSVGQVPWQALLFPVYDGADVRQNRLFAREYRHEQNGDEVISDTRFVVELDTEMLGSFQLDGLVSTTIKTASHTLNNFDMVVRSSKELPGEVQQNIANIFAQMSEITGVKGTFSFQVTKEFPVNPLSELVTHIPVGTDGHNSIIV